MWGYHGTRAATRIGSIFITRNNHTKQRWLSSNISANLSWESVANVNMGMSLEEVCQAVGSHPTTVDKFQGLVRKNCTGAVIWYKGCDGSYLHLLLRDNAVVMIDWKP